MTNTQYVPQSCRKEKKSVNYTKVHLGRSKVILSSFEGFPQYLLTNAGMDTRFVPHVVKFIKL